MRDLWLGRRTPVQASIKIREKVLHRGWHVQQTLKGQPAFAARFCVFSSVTGNYKPGGTALSFSQWKVRGAGRQGLL